MTLSIALYTLSSVTVLSLVGCIREPSMPSRDINLVLHDHAQELMSVPGVVGVAVSARDDGTPCILVMVESADDTIGRHLPTSLEGYPVLVEVTGELRPFSDSGSGRGP